MVRPGVDARPATIDLMPTYTPPAIVFVSTHGTHSREAEALRRDTRRGLAVRVHPGAYVTTDDWLRLSARERQLVRVRAVLAGLPPETVVSHETAVAVHDLPSVHGAGTRVHVLDPARDRVRTGGRVVRHPGAAEEADVVEVGGIRTTSEARTALDVARARPFADGVLCADAVLRRAAVRAGCFARRVSITPDTAEAHRACVEAAAVVVRHELESRLERATGVRGLETARRVVAFASPWPENGGESLCRVALHELGAPPPRMQVEFFDGQELAGRCDFVFGGSVLEFDGKVKYDHEAVRGGLAPSAVVKAEKARERRLVRSGHVAHIGRCDADDVRDRAPLAQILRDIRVPLRTRR